MTRGMVSGQSEAVGDRPPVIYLVDDDPAFLRALSRRLEAEGSALLVLVWHSFWPGCSCGGRQPDVGRQMRQL